MREIKFRAWDKDKAQMIYPSILGIGFENFAWQHGRDYIHNCQDWGNEDGFIYDPILMQFTGRKDKIGKEIYKGDINQDKGVVIWNESDASFCWDYKDIEVLSMGEENEWCEVIGNIYENPELTNL